MVCGFQKLRSVGFPADRSCLLSSPAIWGLGQVGQEQGPFYSSSLRRLCVGCQPGPFYSSSCSQRPALRTQMGTMRRVGAHAMQAMQVLRQLSPWTFLQQLMLRDACPANSNGDQVPSRCSCNAACNAGYAGTASAVTPVPSTAGHAQRCLPCELKWRSCAEQVLRQCRLCRHCVGCHSSPFYSSSCSEMPALRTQMEITRRVGAQAMQAMQILRRLSLRSFLQQLMLRYACPANSDGDRVPSRCSCSAGWAGTASAVTTVLSTAAHAQRFLPCELKWRSGGE